MMNRAEMNEEMMEQVNGGFLFDPVDVFFPEAPEKKKEREETRYNLIKEILDFVL